MDFIRTNSFKQEALKHGALKHGAPIRIKSDWCDDFIPAIYLGNSTVIVGWIDVWIPEGYGFHGYSSRDRFYEFTWEDEVKYNILQLFKDRAF